MVMLEAHEIRCLRAIHDGTLGELSPCAPHTLSRLVAKGLITITPASILPLPLLHNAYALTEAGKEILNKLKND